MEKEVRITDLLDKLEKEELDFLPPDDYVRKSFMAFIKFIIIGI
jgi:hypothetical protein